MSLEQYAFIARSDVPTRAQWQSAIDALGFDLSNDPSLVPFESSGFLPCLIRDEESGFEIYYESAAELTFGNPQLKEAVGAREASISFRWGGDFLECACVLIASAALAKSCNAVVYYPDDDKIYDVEALLAEARAVLDAER